MAIHGPGEIDTLQVLYEILAKRLDQLDTHLDEASAERRADIKSLTQTISVYQLYVESKHYVEPSTCDRHIATVAGSIATLTSSVALLQASHQEMRGTLLSILDKLRERTATGAARLGLYSAIGVAIIAAIVALAGRL